ncbi:MAG TPA: hypothetical protein VNE40_02800 [Candidatus Dormibacteraeota bacterium]|nr:hypothetical protein [Candidatus Dormibacteraeota bacterium]
MEPQNIYDPSSEEQIPRGNVLNDLERSKAVNSFRQRENKSSNQGGVLSDRSGNSTHRSGTLTAGSLATAEQLGVGFRPVDQTKKSRISGLLKTSPRKSLVGGGIGGGIIVLIIFGMSAIIPYELVHIEKTLIAYESKVEQRFEKRAAQKVLQKVVCWHLKAGCKNIPGDNKPSAAEDRTAQADGENLSTEMENFDFTDPVVIADLAKVGYTVVIDPSTGEFNGLKNAEGQDVTQEIGNNGVVFSDLETALPEWSVGQEISFRPVMIDEAGVSFSGLPDTQNDDVQKTIEGKIVNGASGDELVTANEEETGGQPPANDTNANDLTQYTDANNQSGALGKALDAANQAASNGATGETAVEAGVKSFDFGNPIFLTSIASTACGLEKDVSHASSTRVPKIMSLLIRHGNLVLTLADQLKAGKLTGHEVKQVMKIFNGDPSAKPNSNGTPSEASLPFTSSAAWQRSTGGLVSNNTPDINTSSLPTQNSGTKIFGKLRGILNKSGATFSCHALTSPFGFIIQGFAGVFQIAADGFSFGTAQVAFTAGIIAVQQGIQHFVLPDIIRYFTPYGINGSENSVQFLNNADAGLFLSFSNYSRRIGGIPLTTPQADNLTAMASHESLVAFNQLPWINRMFDTSNPISLVSRLASDVPQSLGQVASSTVSYFTNITRTIPHYAAAIFLLDKVSALNNTTYPGDPYGATQYAFMDNEINKYDPVQNEQYLFSNVSVDNNSARRIDILGNPNTYTDNPSGDQNNNDLLHCFVDSYILLADSVDGSTSAAKKFCGNIGTYDIKNDSPSVIPNDSTAASIYCSALAPNDLSCPDKIAPQLNDEVGHFRQYLLDTHVMTDYTNLLSK